MFRAWINRSLGNSRGDTLLTVLMAAALTTLVLIAGIDGLKKLIHGSQTVGEKNDRHDLKQFILAAFSDPSNCSCQLDSTLNTALASDLFIDTTAAKIPDINLRTLRSGCNFTSPNNIIAQSGQRLPSSLGTLTVSSVALTRIAATGSPNQFAGLLQVAFKSASPLFPAQVHLLFEVDASSGTASHRRINRCLGAPTTNGLSACTVRYPTQVQKGACGIDASVTCAPGEKLLTGGATQGSLVSLQNSQPLTDAANNPIGWAVSWADNSGCTINAYPNGTTRPMSNPCFANPVPGKLPFCGAAMAVCCKQ